MSSELSHRQQKQTAAHPTFLYHLLGTGESLLAWLEYELHRALEEFFVSLESSGCTQQHRHVRIVPASMHDPLGLQSTKC